MFLRIWNKDGKVFFWEFEDQKPMTPKDTVSFATKKLQSVKSMYGKRNDPTVFSIKCGRYTGLNGSRCPGGELG